MYVFAEAEILCIIWPFMSRQLAQLQRFVLKVCRLIILTSFTHNTIYSASIKECPLSLAACWCIIRKQLRRVVYSKKHIFGVCLDAAHISFCHIWNNIFTGLKVIITTITVTVGKKKTRWLPRVRPTAESNTSTTVNTAEPRGWSYSSWDMIVTGFPEMLTSCAAAQKRIPLKAEHQQANRIINFSVSLQHFHFISICLPFSLPAPTAPR